MAMREKGEAGDDLLRKAEIIRNVSSKARVRRTRMECMDALHPLTYDRPVGL